MRRRSFLMWDSQTNHEMRRRSFPINVSWVVGETHVGHIPPKYGQFDEFIVASTKTVQLRPGESMGDVVFELSAGAQLLGRVVFADGQPAPGAKVAAKAPVPNQSGVVSWNVETASDANGAFVIYCVPEDAAIVVHARMRGRESSEFGPIMLDEALTQEVVLTLRDIETGTVAGQVFDREGKPLAAFVRAEALESSASLPQDLSVTADADGYFLLTDVATGTYVLRFGPNRNGLADFIDSEGPITLAAGQTLNGIRLQLHPAGPSITGVVRKPNGDTVPNYMIEAEGHDEDGTPFHAATVMTDENGAFEIENLSEGLYKLSPVHDSYGRWKIRARAGENVEVVLPEPAYADGPEAP